MLVFNVNNLFIEGLKCGVGAANCQRREIRLNSYSEQNQKQFREQTEDGLTLYLPCRHSWIYETGVCTCCIKSAQKDLTSRAKVNS